MASGHFFWAIFYFACLCSASLANNAKVNFREKEKKILDQILGAGKYDARIRPSGINGTDGPAVVRVNIFVRSISKIDDVTMEYSVQLTFREQWLDERLKFDDIGGRLKYLTLTEANRVWMPDLFFSNEKEGHFHNIIMPNVYIRIFPYGSVLYSIRISLTLACPMNLKLYPLDRQVCSLRMASYGWTTADLVFLWKEGDPVQVVKNLHLPRFTLEKFLTDYCNSKTNTGEYSCLKVDLLFKREFSYYLIQIYIPCCMLVIVSWVSFWLDQGAVPARVSLGVTTLLTMATQTSGINASLPPVSYTKAIDVWTGVCLTFVFGALLEFALVNYASRSADRAADMHRENMKKKRREMEQASLDAASDLLDTDSNATFAMKPLVRHPGDPLALEKLRQCEVHMQAPKRPNCCRSWLSKFPTSPFKKVPCLGRGQCSRSKRIDVISRITFPLVFALFNLVYWSTYLFREEEED
ncbi:glutamate-gated chloride channel isoform X2 [Anopheles maculipalpis]|uniref:glutamate-gated chloride channel isoform X3 n=1 Tax=Anopheles stephensi TaxID=30069 RepID=UPI0016589AB1|nr:glutamate-gated chloride channel isoform X3 [Anopheles stephensi]XP_040159835.1 glutamate-gated chloride channel isoform X2 [Anopheles arabiensis]XP_040240671.1 glutamate-gated chloride channel isoform X2 [Anopheles coluzzii]XP_041767573.1 glutamate-gated chloride channel isoform X2 [Anopheles merus]XP_049278501.1 glutamate-gated chloride channel isoform X2 [Anopheles funestus]XP_050069802.1 glutamate-gated chloride channel isoform X2 [Anopheles maculipalpis]XP_052888270.1 glutamate-gated 